MTQQRMIFAPSKVGSRVVLWKYDYSDEAYIDHFGRKHDGWVVFEEIVVTIEEERTVPGERGISEYTQGYRAVAEDGREFTHDWEHGGDGDHWRISSGDDDYTYADVCRIYRPKHRIFATPEGQPAKPANALVCEEHGSAFMPGSEGTGVGCHECYLNIMRSQK